MEQGGKDNLMLREDSFVSEAQQDKPREQEPGEDFVVDGPKLVQLEAVVVHEPVQSDQAENPLLECAGDDSE